MEVPKQQLAPMGGSIPAGLRYDLSISKGVKGVRTLARFSAENSQDFDPDGNNILRIPVNSTSFLDLNQALLEFDFKNNATGHDVQLDGGADCIIKRLRILSNTGAEVERIEDYNLLATIQDQYQNSHTGLIQDSVLRGSPGRVSDFPFFAEDNSGTAATGEQTVSNNLSGLTVKGTSTTSADAAAKLQLKIASAGGIGYDQKQSDILVNNVVRHYAIPLRGGFFNNLTQKYFPAGVAFTVEITLALGNESLVNRGANAVPKYKISTPELFIPAITIQDQSFMDRYESLKRQGMNWRGLTYKAHVNTVASGAGNTSIQISDRSMNLRALMTIFRLQSRVNGNQNYSLSTRTLQFIDDYQYVVGTNLYPPNLVEIKTSNSNNDGTAANTRLIGKSSADVNVSHAYAEVARMFHFLNQKQGTTCLVGRESYAQSENVNGTGIICADLSTYTDMTVASGVDTASQALPVVLNIKKNAIAQSTIHVQTYAMCDIMFMLSPTGELTSMS